MGQAGAVASSALGQLIAQPAVSPFRSRLIANPTGLSPSQIRTAYGVNQITFGSTTGNGAGQTIAIVDAYYDPNIASDLAKFDSQYKLSGPGSFTQYVESGLTVDNPSWAAETALDVEWAHAIAPAANIVLVEAQPDLYDLFTAVTFAAQQSGVSVVSMSWGTGEFSSEASYDSVFTTPSNHNGVTFVAASGDSSATDYPATSPNVLAVGGTTLNITSQGSYLSETAWSGSGGGYSADEPEPSWQAGAIAASNLNSGARTSPDVAWDGNLSTGVSVYDSVPYGGYYGWFTVGGTSVGAPSWSGLIAIADQGLALNHVGSLSNAQTSLYQLPSSDFNDITSGTSGANSAGKGYDLVTGLGSPKANLLVPGLVQLNTPAAAKTTTPSGSTGTISHQSLSVAVVVAQNPASTGSTSGSSSSGSSSSTSSSTSSSGTSITPLNPNGNTASTVSLIPIFILAPPPTHLIVINLGTSASPVTLQAINSPVAAQEEQPPSTTQFGQALQTELQTPFKVHLAPQQDAPPLIDVVDPFQPLDPADAPNDDLAPGAGQARTWPSPLLVEPVFEGDRGGLPGADGHNSALAPGAGTNAAGFSTLFGVAALTAGGYHLAMRESERFKVRWLPRRAASDRSVRPRIPAR
jgi:subtilase family serine protease